MSSSVAAVGGGPGDEVPERDVVDVAAEVDVDESFGIDAPAAGCAPAGPQRAPTQTDAAVTTAATSQDRVACGAEGFDIGVAALGDLSAAVTAKGRSGLIWDQSCAQGLWHGAGEWNISWIHGTIGPYDRNRYRRQPRG